MKEVAVITSGFLPVPNVLGGAVEALEMTLFDENEKEREVLFRVYSIWNNEAVDKSKCFQNTLFRFIKPPSLIVVLDRFIYWFVRSFLSFECTTTYRYIGQRMWFIFKVAWNLWSDPVDIVLIEDHPILFNCIRMFGNRKRYSGRVYYHLHRDFKKDFGLGPLIADAKRVIGVSQFTIDSLVTFLRANYGIKMNPKQLCVVKNCVNPERFNPSDDRIKESARKMRLSLGIPMDCCVVAFSGRLTPEKGVEELLNAFLRVKYLGARLVVAGSHFYGTGTESPFEERLKRLMDQAADQISFTGYLNYELMPAFYSMADIVCAPSLCEDAAPMAIVEALASGKPVIATRSGGIPEYAQDGSAILINRGEHIVDELAEGLELLISSESKRAEMSDKGLGCSRDLNEHNYYLNFMVAMDAACNLGRAR